MSMTALQETYVLQDYVDRVNMYFYPVMMVRMVALLGESSPQCNVQLFSQEIFTPRFV